MSIAAPATLRTDLAITGMTCGNCARHVEEAVAELGATAVVDVPGAGASIDHPASVTVADLVAAVDEAGYVAEVRTTR